MLDARNMFITSTEILTKIRPLKKVDLMNTLSRVSTLTLSAPPCKSWPFLKSPSLVKKIIQNAQKKPHF